MDKKPLNLLRFLKFPLPGIPHCDIIRKLNKISERINTMKKKQVFLLALMTLALFRISEEVL